MPNQDASHFFIDRQDENEVAEPFRAVLSVGRLQAPVTAYAGWTAALATVNGWSPSAALTPLKAKADAALLKEFAGRAPDRWQRYVALVTQAVWVKGAGGAISDAVMNCFGAAGQDIIPAIVTALAELYDDEAEALPSGPCSYFYLARAALLVPEVITVSTPPVKFYLEAVVIAVDAANVVNEVPGDPNRLPQARADLQQTEAHLKTAADRVRAVLAAIDPDVRGVTDRQRKLAVELHRIGAEMATAPVEKRSDLAARLAAVQEESRKLGEIADARVKLTRVLRYVQTRLIETRDSLDAKARFVSQVRLNATPRSPDTTGGFHPVRWLRVALSGNPRRMNREGWVRAAWLGAAVVFLISAVTILARAASADRPARATQPSPATAPITTAGDA
jgi:hypothetical protein